MSAKSLRDAGKPLYAVPMPNIQVADENDPRLALGQARDAAWDRLQRMQKEVCGCEGGATCATCAFAASEHMRLATEYQNLYSTQWVVRTNDSWWNSPVAQWAWQGDAAQTER